MNVGPCIMTEAWLSEIISATFFVAKEELLSVADLGQTGSKAPQFTQRCLRFHGLLLPRPITAKGRITNAVLESETLELVVGEGIAEPHIVGIAAPDHHVGLGNGKGGRV